MQNILLLGSCEGAGAEDIEQMIRIENVSKWYGDFQVLKNCSTSVKKGEVVVICGPSGSGKSTLIKTVNGLEDYQEGTIYVNNINIGDPHTNLPKLRAHVGMVFQHFELFPHHPRQFDACSDEGPQAFSRSSKQKRHGALRPRGFD